MGSAYGPLFPLIDLGAYEEASEHVLGEYPIEERLRIGFAGGFQSDSGFVARTRANEGSHQEAFAVAYRNGVTFRGAGFGLGKTLGGPREDDCGR